MQAEDETNITELSFLPDGRVCVFGMSREVLDLLGSLNLGDPVLDRRCAHLRQVNQESASLADHCAEPAPIPAPTATSREGDQDS